MRENCLSGSEGGGIEQTDPPYPYQKEKTGRIAGPACWGMGIIERTGV
jgi:hypothetical protein